MLLVPTRVIGTLIPMCTLMHYVLSFRRVFHRVFFTVRFLRWCPLVSRISKFICAFACSLIPKQRLLWS